MTPRLFYKLPQDIAARKDLTASAKVLYAVLGGMMGKNGVAWPGHRKLSKACGIGRSAVNENLPMLAAAGLLVIEKGSNGQSNRYRISDGTGPESKPVDQHGESTNRPGKQAPGGPESKPLPARKASHNKIDQLNQRGAASPPLVLTPSDADSKGKGAAGRLVALWVTEYGRGIGRPFPDSGRGQLAGTIKTLLGGFPADALEAAIPRWFSTDRREYGIALFKSRLEGGDGNLLPRPATGGDNELDRRNWQAMENGGGYSLPAAAEAKT